MKPFQLLGYIWLVGYNIGLDKIWDIIFYPMFNYEIG